jgi:hypothetical protein
MMDCCECPFRNDLKRKMQAFRRQLTWAEFEAFRIA